MAIPIGRLKGAPLLVSYAFHIKIYLIFTSLSGNISPLWIALCRIGDAVASLS